MSTPTAAANPRPDWPAIAHAFAQATDAGELDTFRRRRWPNPDAAGWLEQDRLANLTETQAATLYRAAGGRHIANFRANPIAEIRDAVDFLLYDTVKLENRFEECALATGGFGLAGAGREWPSYLLTLREPNLFAPWSPHTERALRRWGMLPPGFKGGHPGLCYIDLLDVLHGLRVRIGLSDFRNVDEFCYLNGRVKKGAAS